MKLAKILITFVFPLALAVCVSAQKSKVKQIKLSARDKKEIVKQVFDNGFEKLLNNAEFNQCLTPIIDDKKVIFVNSDIDKSFLPNNFEEYRFMIMSFAQVDAEIKKNNGECYFTLNEFRVINSRVRINLNRIIDEIYRFKNSSKYTRGIYGESYIYDFEKAGKWKIISSKRVIISS